MVSRYNKDIWKRVEFLLDPEDREILKGLKERHSCKNAARVLRYCLNYTNEKEEGHEKNVYI